MLSFRFIARSGAAVTVACCFAGAVLVACGGAEISPLDQAPGFATTTTQPDASLPATTPDSSILPTPVPGHDAAPPHDSAPPPPPPSDDAGKDSAPSDDAGEDSAPPPDLGIPCGTKFCDPNLKVCCVSTTALGNPSYECELQTSCDNKGGLSLPCASAADCLASGSAPGTVCCVTQNAGVSNSPTVSCTPAAQCSDPGDAWMCNPAYPQCPSGDSCTASTTTSPPAPYSICTP